MMRHYAYPVHERAFGFEHFMGFLMLAVGLMALLKIYGVFTEGFLLPNESIAVVLSFLFLFFGVILLARKPRH